MTPLEKITELEKAGVMRLVKASTIKPRWEAYCRFSSIDASGFAMLAWYDGFANGIMIVHDNGLDAAGRERWREAWYAFTDADEEAAAAHVDSINRLRCFD